MKTHNILYLGDNTIYLKNKKYPNIIKHKTSKGILVNGKIANTKGFIKCYENILNENNLNNKIFGETIKIIVNPTYTGLDINVLKNIFSLFNYRKILVDRETKYYRLNNHNAYLNIFDNYSILSYLDQYKCERHISITGNMFKSINDYMKYIKYIIEDRELYLLGSGKLIGEVINLFENNFGNKTYIFSDSDTYVISRAF